MGAKVAFVPPAVSTNASNRRTWPRAHNTGPGRPAASSPAGCSDPVPQQMAAAADASRWGGGGEDVSLS